MSENKHTPGPWRWVEDRFRGGYSGLFTLKDEPVLCPQRENDGDGGAAWLDTSGDSGEETLSEADAHLIAAAPEMLEALTSLIMLCELAPPGPEESIDIKGISLKKARKAIAKATGRESA